MVFKNEVKNIQAAAYNGASTVPKFLLLLFKRILSKPKKQKFTLFPFKF